MHKFFYCLVLLLVCSRLTVTAQQRKPIEKRVPLKVEWLPVKGAKPVSRPPMVNNKQLRQPAEPVQRPRKPMNLVKQKLPWTVQVKGNARAGRSAIKPEDLFLYRLPAAKTTAAANASNGRVFNTTASCDDITLTRQSEIDSFPILYPDCHVVRRITIEGDGASPAITRLDSLKQITEITEDLNIYHTAVPDLSGLNNITHIGSYLSVQNNAVITSLGLTNLTSLKGLVLNQLPNLQSMDGLLNNLEDYNMWSILLIDVALSNLEDFSNVTSMGNFALINCPNITTLHGLENLMSCAGGISLINAPLTDISQLSHITDIDHGSLELKFMNLTSLNGLQNITRIHGTIQMEYMWDLSSLSELNNTLVVENQEDTGDVVRIRENSQLSLCSVPFLCRYLQTGLAYQIEYNGPQCGTIAQITASCDLDGCTVTDEKQWNGNNSSNWDDPGNWTPAGVPTSCTKVTIPSSNDYNNGPVLQRNTFIGGLVMYSGSDLELDNYDLTITRTLQLDNANLYNGGNILASGIHGADVKNTYIEGQFSLRNFDGETSFQNNSFSGNTVFSDSYDREDRVSYSFNNFYGNLTITNNSNYGQHYLSNASPYYDYVQGNLTIINNSSADISVGLGDGRPLKVQGDFNVQASDGQVNIHNLTLVGGTFNPNTRQLGDHPIVIDNLFLESGAETRLDHSVQINNSLVFDNGSNKINTTSGNLLILNNGATVTRDPANNRGFINGPMKKIGSQPFTFPVGKYEFDYGGDNYGPISISAPASNTDEFTAEYFHHSPGREGYDTALHEPGFGGISAKEYWTLVRNNGTTNVQARLSYDSARSGAAYQYNLMQVAGWNGSQWKSWSSGGYTGNIAKGTVISATPLTGYGPLTLSFKPVRKPVVSINAMDPVRCLNSAFYVHYTADTAMTSGNQMRIEISDTLGNFSTFWNPTFGSKYTSAATDSILFYSTALQPNKDYKIRIVGNLPPDTSVNTQTIRFITAPQNTVTVAGADQACLGTGAYKYYPSFVEPGVTYSWVLSGGGTLAISGDTAIVNWATTGLYSLQLKVMNACGEVVRGLFVVVKPPAPATAPTIVNNGRWLQVSSTAPAGATDYRWYRNSILIAGASAASYYAADAGTYTAVYHNDCGQGPASNGINFTAPSVSQTITFPAITNKTYGDTAFALQATTSSGLPVSYTIISGPGSIAGNYYTITNSGTVTIRATQPGDNTYDTAVIVYRTFVINKAAQTINLSAIADQALENGSLLLNATASSGLPVSYNLVSGPATLAGNQLTFTAVGQVTIQAVQAGDTNYLAAPNVNRSFCIRVAALTIIAGAPYVCPGQTVTYSINQVAGVNYSWRLSNGTTYPSVTNTASITWPTPGTYTLLVSAAGPCGAASANDTLIVHVQTPVQPGAASNMLPAGGETGLQLPLNLSWIPGSNALTYDVYIWDSATAQPSVPFVADLANVSFVIPNGALAYNKTYKWKIVAKNACLQTDGPVQQFRLRPLPDLMVSNVQLPASAFSGQTITINWRVTNNGPGNTTTNQSWTDAVFLSFDTIPNFVMPPAVGASSWSQLDFPVRPLLVGTKNNVSALDSGQHYDNSINFTLPVNYSQPLYAYVITNYPAGNNAPLQMTYSNDTARAANALAVTLSPTPDLRVDTVFTPASTFSGSTINVAYRVKNYGVLTPAGSNWQDKIYISSSPFFNINNATQLTLAKANGTYYPGAADATIAVNTQLKQDSSYTRNVQVVVPNFIYGDFFIYVVTNSGNMLYEGALANNNTGSNQLQVFLTPTPKLTVSGLTVPVTTASTTQPIGLNWNIVNTGVNDNLEKNKGHYYIPSGICNAGILFNDSISYGSSYWTDKVYLSTDAGGLNIANAIYIGEVSRGIQNSGISVDGSPATICAPAGTDAASLNINTGNVIKPGGSYPQTLNFVIPANLPAGNYYVYVVANANKTVYEYPGTLQTGRSALPLTIQRPDVIVSAISAPATGTGGQPVVVTYNVQNNGAGAVFNQLRNDRLYISTSAVFDGSAQAVAAQAFTENLAVGTPVTHTFNYVLPPATSGTRYFYVWTNYDSTFRESNINNNISTGAAVMISTATPVDLTVTTLQLPDSVFTWIPGMVKYTVTNNGTGTTHGTWTDSLYVSCSNTFSYGNSFLAGIRQHSDVLATGGAYTDSFNISLPFTPSMNNCFPNSNILPVYFFLRANADGGVYEGSNAGNNLSSAVQRTLVNTYVDHIVTTVAAPDTATVARNYKVTWTVKNTGYNPGSAIYSSSWYDAVWFSPDSVFNSNAILATRFAENTRLNREQSYTDTRNAVVPNIPTGDYYVFVKTDNDNYIVAEAVKNNNTNLLRTAGGMAKKIHVIQPVLPDLTDTIIVAPATAAIGQPITIIHTVTNKGAGVTYPETWSNELWLSTDFIPGNSGDIKLAAKNRSGALQPGQSYNDTVTATLALTVPPGNYILISKVNASGNVAESNDTNNLAFRYLTVYAPAPADLLVENITIPDTVYLGYTINTLQWTVRNNAPNTASGISADGIYLSHSDVLDSTAVLIGIRNKNINIAPLGSETLSQQPLVTQVPEGAYRLLVRTDLQNNIVESDKNNNTGISAGSIYVKVKELVLETAEINTLASTARYYKLRVPASLLGSTILVTLKTSDSLTMRNELYIGAGYVPSAAKFDYKFETANAGNQQIVMTSVTDTLYYIHIRCVSANPSTQNITLKATVLPFAILSVQSASGGNTGNVTVKINGSLFTPGMTAQLRNAGTTITASAVYYTNSTTVYATFNLQNKALGVYDVVLTKPDAAVAVLPGGFSIVSANNGGLITGGGINSGSGDGNGPGCDPGAASGLNSQLVTEMVIPEKVFAGWPFVIQLNYSNPTNVDVPAQVRTLYNDKGVVLALSQAALSNGSTSLYLQLSEPGGPPGIIRAGASGTITIYARTPVDIPAHTIVHFNLK